MIYVILIIWILYCGFYYFHPQFRKVTFGLIIVALTLTMGLRSTSVGVDTSHYKSLFDSISMQSFSVLFNDYYYEALEPGWVLINKIVALFGGNYYAFQLIVSIAFCGIYGYVLNRESKNPYISIVSFLPTIYLIAFNIQRQMLAGAILFLCWHLFRLKKYRVLLVFLLLAYSIHETSIIFIYSFMLYAIRGKKYFLPVVLGSVIVIISSYMVIIDYFAAFFSKYNNYYNNTLTRQTAGFVKIVWIIEILLASYVLIRSKRFTDNDKCIAALSIICVSSFYVGLEFNYFERVGLIFSPFLLLLFPTVGNSFTKPIRFLFNMAVIISFLAWFYISCSGQYIYSTWV